MVGEVVFDRFSIIEEQHKGSRGVSVPVVASSDAPVRLVDLSHTLREGLVTLPGVPAPSLTAHLRRGEGSYAPGTSFSMDIVTIPGNSGTYLDTAWHRYEGGADLAALDRPDGRSVSARSDRIRPGPRQVELRNVAAGRRALDLTTLVDLPTEVFHLADSTVRGVPASVFYDRDVRGKAVLLHTGWDRHFGTPEYAQPAPFLTAEGVQYLAKQGVRLVGIDSLNIDDTSPDALGERPAHTSLLANGTHVVEHLTNLGELPPSGALFTAVPPKFEGTGTFTVRDFAKLPA